MRKLHAVASFGLLLLVLLACKRGEEASADAGVTSAPAIVSAADPASTTASAPASYKVGDTVDVEWSGSWYESQILAVLPGPQYKIHYVGWSNSYDETVGPSRMRARAGGSAPSATAIASATSSAHAAPIDTTDHVSKCARNQEYAGAPYNACLQDCMSETDCSKACIGDFIVSSCSECSAGQSCIQVQHPMEDGVGWSKACVGKTGKGCSHASTTPTANATANASPFTAGCRAGWSRPRLEPGTECMQDCNTYGVRDTCPAGYMCQYYMKTWVSPHCEKQAH